MSILLKLDSSSITTGTPQDFTVRYNGLQLDSQKRYECALIKSSLWYSWYNVSASLGNNTFRYSHNGGVAWRGLHTIPDGLYSISQLNTQIELAIFSNGDYTIDPYNIILNPDYSTLKCVVTLYNDFQLDLTTSTLHSLLGFTSKIVTATESGANPADITGGVNSIAIHCDLIQGSYENEIASDVIYSFSPQSGGGTLLSVEANNPIYLPLNRHNQITSIRMRITDQRGLTLDLNSQHVDFLLHIRESR